MQIVSEETHTLLNNFDFEDCNFITANVCGDIFTLTNRNGFYSWTPLCCKPFEQIIYQSKRAACENLLESGFKVYAFKSYGEILNID